MKPATSTQKNCSAPPWIQNPVRFRVPFFENAFIRHDAKLIALFQVRQTKFLLASPFGTQKFLLFGIRRTLLFWNIDTLPLVSLEQIAFRKAENHHFPAHEKSPAVDGPAASASQAPRRRHRGRSASTPVRKVNCARTSPPSSP